VWSAHGGKVRGTVAACVVVAGIALTHPWRWFLPFEDFVNPPEDLPFAIPVLLLISLWWLSPFLAVAAAIGDAMSSAPALAVSLAVAVAGTLLVPVWTESAIEDDPSSTAVLVHFYDPLPVVLGVGAVLLADYAARRLARRLARQRR
jgi:hypothetical protein